MTTKYTTTHEHTPKLTNKKKVVETEMATNSLKDITKHVPNRRNQYLGTLLDKKRIKKSKLKLKTTICVLAIHHLC